MGWDIETIGKHTLDTSTVEAVAKQLAKAWDVNIRYGYHRYYILETETLKIIEGDLNFICLGEVISKTSDAQYMLTDENYSVREILKQLNNDLSSVKWEEGTKEYFMEEITTWTLYELDLTDMHNYAKKHPDDNFIAHSYIFKEAILLSLYNDLGGWTNFINSFEINSWDVSFKDLNEYRLYLRTFFKAAGTEKIYYFPDQGPAQIILDELSRPWDEVEDYILNARYYDDECNINESNNRHLRKIIDIPTFIKARNPEYSTFRSNIFTDDFSDLDENYQPLPKEKEVIPEPESPYKFRNLEEELNWEYFGIPPDENDEDLSLFKNY